MSGLQSLHTDAYDEAITTPTEETARIAVATQNILREEAHLCDVIDPLGGSYYLETLTDRMEREIEGLIAKIDAAGGMYKAAEAGLVQAMIGASALSFTEAFAREPHPDAAAGAELGDLLEKADRDVEEKGKSAQHHVDVHAAVDAILRVLQGGRKSKRHGLGRRRGTHLRMEQSGFRPDQKQAYGGAKMG